MLADEKLKKVFAGKGEVTMFEMAKLIGPHVS
ncbi:MAG: SWIB/MDM2 domain-containing protein [bacterium]|nr:SWIB/MDM2 domain-containing protein [bacterium]